MILARGLQERGQLSAGLVDVEDALEEWGEYHREPKLKGALSYLDQCIVDWDEDDLKNPSAYSWEGDNYSRGYSPHLIGWTEQTGECVRSLSRVSSEVPTGNRTHGLIVDGPKGSDYTGGLARSLSRVSSDVPTGNRRRVSCGVQSSGVDKEVYELPAIESLGVKTACVRGDAAVLNPGVHGSGSFGYGGNHLGSPDILFIGKGPSGSHRGVGVSGTDVLSLSPLSEREGPDYPLSIKSYDTATVHLQHAGNNGIWSPGSCTPANTPIPTPDESFAYTPEMERETRVELRSRLPCVIVGTSPLPYRCVSQSLVEGPSEDTYGRCVARDRRISSDYDHSFARLIPANANGVLSKEGAIPSVVVDPLSGSGSFGIHTSSGKLDPPLESVCAGPTQVGLEKLIANTNPMSSGKGVGSDVVGLVPLRSDVIEYVEETEWGTDDYQVDAESLKERSGEYVADDEFDSLCKINTETNSRALDSKEREELNAERVIDLRKRKRLVTLNPTVTWDNGTTSKVKQLSDHKVIRSVRRKLEVPTAPLEDTGVRSEDEVSDEECARLKRERVLLNESCTAKMLTHLRDSIHSDPESMLLYWVSRVYDDKDLRMTMCDRVLILPNEEILASSEVSKPDHTLSFSSP